MQKFKKYSTWKRSSRFFTSSSNKLSTGTNTAQNIENIQQVKSFKEIPGPRGFLGLGTIYKYFPIIGKFNENYYLKSKI